MLTGFCQNIVFEGKMDRLVCIGISLILRPHFRIQEFGNFSYL